MKVNEDAYTVEFTVKNAAGRELAAEILAHDESDDTYFVRVLSHTFQIRVDRRMTQITHVIQGSAAPFADRIVTHNAEHLVEACRLFREQIIGFPAMPTREMLDAEDKCLASRPPIKQTIEPTYL